MEEALALSTGMAVLKPVFLETQGPHLCFSSSQ